MAASRAPRLDLGIWNNTIIRSGMKFILNFRHNIEKYGFKCLEFGEMRIPVRRFVGPWAIRTSSPISIVDGQAVQSTQLHCLSEQFPNTDPKTRPVKGR